MGLTDFVARVVGANIDAVTGDYESKLRFVDKLQAEVERLRYDLEHEKQRSKDYFRIIEEMQVDRDRWRGMFHQASEEHCTAQSMMEKGIENAGVICGRMLELLNQYRKKAKQPAWNMGDVFKSMPKTSEAYKAKMKALVGLGPEPFDGVAERDKVGPAPK